MLFGAIKRIKNPILGGDRIVNNNNFKSFAIEYDFLVRFWISKLRIGLLQKFIEIGVCEDFIEAINPDNLFLWVLVQRYNRLVIVKGRLMYVIKLMFLAIVQKRALLHHVKHTTIVCFNLWAKHYLFQVNVDVIETDVVGILTHDHFHLNDFNWAK